MREITFSDGYTSGSAPTAVSHVGLIAETNQARNIADNSGGTGQFLCEDIVYDSTDNNYDNTTGILTVTQEGEYTASASIQLASNTAWSKDEVLEIRLYKNGSYHRRMGIWVCEVTATVVAQTIGSCDFYAEVGDTFEVRIVQNSGNTIATSGTAANNWISFKKLGF